MKAFLLAICLVVAFPASAQDFSKPITYTTKAIPLKAVLKELSTQGGVKLESTQDLEEEPLILRLSAVPLKEVMDRTADVFAADWVDHQGFWRLERSQKKVAQIKKDLLEKRAAAIQTSLDKQMSFQKQHSIDAQGADAYVKAFYGQVAAEESGNQPDNNLIVSLEAEKPLSRLSSTIISTLNAAELAAIPVGRRVVYSSTPNSQQKQLPTVPAAPLEEFNKENALVSAAIKQDVPSQMRQSMESITGHLDGPISRVDVAASADIIQDQIKFTITYFSSTGVPSTEDFESFGFTAADQQDLTKQFLIVRTEAMKTGFELDPIAKEIAPFTISRPTEEARPVSAAAQNFLLHPTQFDPLSLATSQILLKSGELENENVVCLPTDQTEFYALNSARLGKTNFAALQLTAEKVGKMNFEDKDGWLIGRPKDPQDAADSRLPRPQLEKFIQSAFARGFVNLDDGADLCGSVGPLVNIQLARRYVSYIMPGRYLDVMWDNPNMLRVFGLLSPRQRDLAKTKLSVRLADLDADEREAVRHFIFDSDNPLMQYIQQPDGRDSNDFQERTDFFSNGVKDDMQLVVTDLDDPIYYSQIQHGLELESQTIEPERLPELLAETRRPELYDAGNIILVKQAAAGTRRLLNIRVIDTGKYTEDAAEERHQPGALLPLDQFLASLPDLVRQKLEADVATHIQWREEYRNRVQATATPAPAPGGVKPPARR